MIKKPKQKNKNKGKLKLIRILFKMLILDWC